MIHFRVWKTTVLKFHDISRFDPLTEEKSLEEKEHWARKHHWPKTCFSDLSVTAWSVWSMWANPYSMALTLTSFIIGKSCSAEKTSQECKLKLWKDRACMKLNSNFHWHWLFMSHCIVKIHNFQLHYVILRLSSMSFWLTIPWNRICSLTQSKLQCAGMPRTATMLCPLTIQFMRCMSESGWAFVVHNRKEQHGVNPY